LNRIVFGLVDFDLKCATFAFKALMATTSELTGPIGRGPALPLPGLRFQVSEAGYSSTPQNADFGASR